MPNNLDNWEIYNKFKIDEFDKYMFYAFQEAYTALNYKHGGCFGAVLVNSETKEYISSHNTVLKTNDPTTHAEINVIRLTCSKIKNRDLSKYIIFSSTEPCPMCFSAINWARIPIIFWSTSIADVQKLGFNEMNISNWYLNSYVCKRKLIIENFNRKTGLKILEEWKKKGGQVY